MIKIVFASNNKGKYLELVDDFKKVGIDLIFMDRKLHLTEDSEILKENAIKKASAAALQTGMMALGDDSAVCFEALDYFPGVHSRRWMGKEEEDSVRNEAILEMMKNESDRTAFLISRFALVDKDGKFLFSTVVKNEFKTAYTESGTNGFGYDKILIPSDNMLNQYLLRSTSFSRDDYDYIQRSAIVEDISTNQRTIAELSQENKNSITYRGRIAEQIKDFLCRKD